MAPDFHLALMLHPTNEFSFRNELSSLCELSETGPPPLP
jgi:hypothetical protein